jgi:hypothetical protein
VEKYIIFKVIYLSPIFILRRNSWRNLLLYVRTLSHHNFSRLKHEALSTYLQTTSLLTQYCAGGKIEKNEIGRARGAYGGGESCVQGFGGEA